MKQLVEHIARALVDYPDQVDVQQVEGERSVIRRSGWHRMIWEGNR